MKNIFFRDGILIYYGNPAGYLSEGKVVLDSIFDKEEIIAFLSEKEKLAVEIRSGVYDRLSEGGGMEMTVEASKGRRIRIYQLKQDSPFNQTDKTDRIQVVERRQYESDIILCVFDLFYRSLSAACRTITSADLKDQQGNDGYR